MFGEELSLAAKQIAALAIGMGFIIFEPVQYENLKEFAARLQIIIRQYWGEVT